MAVALGTIVTVLALVAAATGHLKEIVDNLGAILGHSQKQNTGDPGPVDSAGLVVTELRVIPVWPQINGPKLWRQPSTNVSPEYLGFRLQATIKKSRTEAIESCDAQTIDKNGQPGYCVDSIDAFTPGSQQAIREVLCKDPSATYTAKTKYRIVCTRPGVISPWYPIELPDPATAVEK